MSYRQWKKNNLFLLCTLSSGWLNFCFTSRPAICFRETCFIDCSCCRLLPVWTHMIGCCHGNTTYCWFHLTSNERGISVSACVCLYTDYRRVLVLVRRAVTLHMLTLHAHAHSKWGEINSMQIYLLLFMYMHSMLGAHGPRWYGVHTIDTVPMLQLGIQGVSTVSLPYSAETCAAHFCLVGMFVWLVVCVGEEREIHQIIQLRLLCACPRLREAW